MLIGSLAVAPTRPLTQRLALGGVLAALIGLSAGLSAGLVQAAPASAPPQAGATASAPASASSGMTSVAGEQAYYLHASACVAAIKLDVLDRVAVYQPAQTAQREEILRLTEQSFAFVGTAYKMGLRNPQAKQLLDDAEQRHAELALPAQRKLSRQCQAEGARLVAEANVLERLLVRNRAAARVNKLLPPVSKP